MKSQNIKDKDSRAPTCVNVLKAGGLRGNFPCAPCHRPIKECLKSVSQPWTATPYVSLCCGGATVFLTLFFLSNDARLFKIWKQWSDRRCKFKPKHNTALTPTWVKVPHISRLSCGCIATAGAATEEKVVVVIFHGGAFYDASLLRDTNRKGTWPLLDTSNEAHVILNADGSADARANWFDTPVSRWQWLKGRAHK